MKICVITDDFFPNLGGIANVLGNIYKEFQESDHELIVINPFSQNDKVFKILKTTKFSIKDFPTFLMSKTFYKYLTYSIWSLIQDKRISFINRINIILYFITKPKILMRVMNNIQRLHPFLKRLDIDLLVAGHSGWLLPLVFVLSRIFNKKIITLAYGNDFLVRNPLTFKTNFFKNADKIIVINNQMKQIIEKMHHLNTDQLEVVYVGLNFGELNVKNSKKELRQIFNIPEDQFVILSVGRHVSRKKFDLVIKAVSEIKKLKPSLNIKYFLIGEGKETTNLKKLTKQLHLEENVDFLGSCDADIRNKFYKLSDIFIMASTTLKNSIEGFGIVFLEANYFKIPVIGSATGGMTEAILDGKTGLLVKPDNLEDLVEKILQLINDKEKRIKLGENGYQRVLSDFDWKNIIQKYIRLFCNVLKDDH